jgi:hypothetical protein
MARSVKNQIRRSLRLGIGLATFFVAMAPLVDGLRRILWEPSPPQLAWTQVIGWLELLVAAALLIYTTGVWMQWVAGCMLIGSLKGISMMLMGGPNPPPHLATSVGFFVVTLVLMAGIALRGITFFDRIALTFYIFCIAWYANKGLFAKHIPLALGLTGLVASWCVYFWNRRDGAKTWRHPLTPENEEGKQI